MTATWWRWAAVFAAVATVGGCGSGGDAETIDVFAAASLTDAFESMAERFETANPDVDVRLNLAGSSALREQILAGAPADVFASADRDNMTALVDAGRVDEPVTFATNHLQIAVPAGNPAGVEGLADFADPDRLIGLCAGEVPCGDLARQVLSAAGVVPSVDTEEPDVRALLLKVGEGELDAGLVYASDVAVADDVEGIDLPAAVDVVADYPIATVGATESDGTADDDADAFVAFVVGAEGQGILADHGFGPS